MNEARVAQDREIIDRLYDSLPCGIVMYEFSEIPHLISCNPAALKMFGYSDVQEFNDVIEHDINKVFPPGELTKLTEAFAKRLRVDTPVVYELTLYRKNGGVCNTATIMDVELLEDGTKALRDIFIDVTKEKERARQRDLYRYSSELFSVYDEVYELNYAKNMAITLTSKDRIGERAGSIRSLDELIDTWMHKRVNGEEDKLKLQELLNHNVLRQKCTLLNRSVSIEFKLVSQSGKQRWYSTTVFLIEENVYLMCSIDITEKKSAERLARENAVLLATQREQERYRIIVEQTGATVVEFDLLNHTFYASDSYIKYELSEYATIPGFGRLQNQGDANSALHPHDVEKYHEFIENLADGSVSSSMVIRLKMRTGDFRWSKVTRFTAYGADGEAVRLVGTILDVEDEYNRDMKRRDMEEALRAKAEIDGGTGLLNKGAVETAIKVSLKNFAPGTYCALFMIDIDDFKYVNDTLGHIAGDNFLRSTAKSLRRVFRQNDVVGRIGGDEFMILMRESTGEGVVEKKAEQILNAVRSVQIPQIGSVSCSIGVRIVKEPTDTPKEEVDKADKALYQVKESGKGRYLIYDDSCEKNDGKMRVPVHTNIDQK